VTPLSDSIIKILVVDDHRVIRDGLRMMLDSDDEFQVIGEARDGKEALELTRVLNPDVVLMDISMPGMDGITATHQISESYPNVKVLVLTMYTKSQYVKELTDVGATGFLTKNVAQDDLREAIHTVVRGEFYLHPEIAGVAFKELISDAHKSGAGTLSGRERDVVRLIAQGSSVVDAAKALFVSPRTVQTHLYNAMKKLGLHSKRELILFAIREGLIVTPE
jgi:DNA-binding NarL/FixJ family response regulator